MPDVVHSVQMFCTDFALFCTVFALRNLLYLNNLTKNSAKVQMFYYPADIKNYILS